MEVLCRLCLVEDATAVNIFSNVSGDSTVPNRLIFCTSLEIEQNDGLPQHICATCRLELEEYYHFRKKCYAADRRLREHKRLLSQGKPSDLYSDDINDVGSQVKLTRKRDVQNITQWRQSVLQRLRAEMQEYQKGIKDICKQELRAELEQQIRREQEDIILPEEKKKIRLKVLDELFYELETYFVRKRNETTHGINIECSSTHLDNNELGSNSTLICQDVDLSGIENHSNNVNEGEIDYVEIIVDNQNDVQRVKEEILNRIQSPNTLIEPSVQLNPDPPMVEINMQNDTLNHLREDSTPLLLQSNEKLKEKEIQDTKTKNKMKRRQSIAKSRDVFCRKHIPAKPLKNRTARFIEKNNESFKNCARCKLRCSQSVNMES